MKSLHADFHTHSNASDGTLAPAELIELSARLGLSHIALTDHDTTGGIAAAIAAGDAHSVGVIPGIEFSTRVDRGELHILGYGIDPESSELQRSIESFRQSRLQRGEQILDRLDDLGYPLDRQLLVRDNLEDSFGRPHIARALLAAGAVDSVSAAFDRFLGAGRPAFVQRHLIEPEEAIELIHHAGGIAVIAHPFSAPDYIDIIDHLRKERLDGIECFYGEYTPDQRTHLDALARELGLLATGGSDFHGPAFREGRDLGSVEIPEQVVANLLSRLGLSRWLRNA